MEEMVEFRGDVIPEIVEQQILVVAAVVALPPADLVVLEAPAVPVS